MNFCCFYQIHLYEVISRINKAKKMLIQEHGRQPHAEEIAELVGLTVEKMQTIIKSARAPTSMERPIGEEKSTTVGVSFRAKYQCTSQIFVRIMIHRVKMLQSTFIWIMFWSNAYLI